MFIDYEGSFIRRIMLIYLFSHNQGSSWSSAELGPQKLMAKSAELPNLPTADPPNS